ncbi:MAG: DNA translocase FtsK [Candidatus Paceibacterota bacterium]
MGAEKLLGLGDMLYLSSDNPRLTRIQSAFVSLEEIKSVVSYLKSQEAGALDTINLDDQKEGSATSFMSSLDGNDDDVGDDMFEDAKEAVIEAGKASTSYLQRKLRIGYSRAARLMDILEEQGIIGPADGSRAREVIAGRDSDSGDTDTESDDERRES